MIKNNGEYMKHIVTRSFLESLVSTKPLSLRRKEAIKHAKTAREFPFAAHVLKADGTLEVYRGTEATKQGYWKLTIFSPWAPGVHSETYEIKPQ